MRGPAGPHPASPAELKRRLEAEAAGLPFLLYRAGGEQRIVTLGTGVDRVAVGRGEEVDVRLDHDEEVSRLHAELERIGGEWTVSDDGLSRNGSMLNGERVGGRRRLRHGDELRFGATLVCFFSPGGSGDSETAIPSDLPVPEKLTEAQRRILIALCRPFRDGSAYATPATNQQIADEVFLSLDAVKGHLRVLFEKFGVGDLPQNQKRVRLVELALRSGLISLRELS